MSTQTFSKVFLFPNNKRKPKSIFPITTGPARGNNWPTATFGLRNRAKGKGDSLARGSGPRPTWPSSAEARRPRHAGVPDATAVRPLPAGRRPLPTTIGQTGVSAGSARRWRTRVGYPRGWRRDGGRKPFHGEAKRGGAMTDDGENAQGRYTLLKWCACSEHQVPGSEAERRVLDCGQWWTTGGQFLPAGLRWR